MAVLSSSTIDYWFCPFDAVDDEVEEVLYMEDRWIQAIMEHKPFQCAAIENKRCEHCKRIFGDDLFIWKIRVYFVGKGDDALPSDGSVVLS